MMVINEISLFNFRNYKKIKIKFNKKINIIIGNNAEGKTNILEAVNFLSITKSYRTSDEKTLILLNHEDLKVVGKIKTSGLIKKLSIVLNKKQKFVYINDSNIKKIYNYITNFNTILICPEDIEIIKGSPMDRRNLLNLIISQISKNYVEKYNEFNKLLKMRNDYLKMLYTNSISDIKYFDIITSNLIDREIYIYNERKKIITEINEIISDIFKDLSDFNDIHIEYIPNICLDDLDFDNEKLRDQLLNKYKQNLNKEINLGMTIIGPHRDEIIFICENKDLKYFGSQGQQKLAMIALKLSILYLYKKKTGEFPVLLMDDIFSELDKKKKNKLVSYVNNIGQVIITTNDIRDINKKLLVDSKIFEVKNNNIKEKVM